MENYINKIENINKDKLIFFWLWNGRLKRNELKRQIIEMKEKGIGGFVIHPREGLEKPDFLSKEWFDFIRYTIKIAKENKIDVWIYDDFNWPSGNANGVVTNKKKYRQKIMNVGYEYDLLNRGFVEIDSKYSKEMLGIYAVDFKDNNIINLTKHLLEQKIDYKLPYKADWRIIGIEKEEVYANNKYYLDYLSSDAVNSFISVAYKSYEEFFKDIVGFFTDEPGLNYYLIFYGIEKKTFIWSDCIPKIFKEEYGYDFLDFIPAFFFNLGSVSKKVRLDYCKLVKGLFEKNYFKKIADYCRVNNLKFIGHSEDDDNIWRHARGNLDVFMPNYHFTYGGCDALFAQTWPEKYSIKSFFAAKFASSSSHLMAKEKTLCEAFALSDPWYLNLRKIKWITDFLFILGINSILVHAYYYSLKGFRKFESPPSQSHQVSYWKDYNIYSEYVENIQKLLSGSKHLCKVCIFYPIDSLWENLEFDLEKLTKYPPRSKVFPNNMWGRIPTLETVEGKISNFFEELSIKLFKENIDFDYINDDFLINSIIDKKKINIFDRDNNLLENYSTIIFPYCTFYSEKLKNKINEMISRGVEVIFGGINYFNNKKSLNIKDILRKLILEKEIIIKGNHDNGVVCKQFKKNNKNYIIFQNTSLDRIIKCKIKIKTNNSNILRYDPIDDINKNDLKFCGEDNFLILFYNFNPTESIIIKLTNENNYRRSKKDTKIYNKYSRSTLKLNGTFNIKILNYNNLPLMKIKENSFDNKKIFKFRFSLLDEVNPLHLLIDGDLNIIGYGNYIELNGVKIKKFTNSNYFDRDLIMSDISNCIVKGSNELVCTSSNIINDDLKINFDLKLLGYFSVDKKMQIKKINKTINLGTLVNQGYPFYAGDIEYHKEVLIEKQYFGKEIFIKFNSFEDIVKVFINNELVKILAWDPYIVKISDFIIEGNNLFKFVITNTLHNFIYRNNSKNYGLIKAPEIIILK